MKIVYALSEKGALERASGSPSLPAELGHLLNMVDGTRTHDQLMAAAGKNAVTAGGLRWLSASGYILATQEEARGRRPGTPVSDGSTGLPPIPYGFGDASSRPAPQTALNTRSDVRSERDICLTLSRFMVQAIRRHLTSSRWSMRSPNMRGAMWQPSSPIPRLSSWLRAEGRAVPIKRDAPMGWR